MTEFPQRVRDAIDRGYEFNFGGYVNKGFQLMQENILLFGGFTFVYTIIAIFSSFIPFIGDLVFSIVVAPCLWVGYLIVSKLTNENRPVNFGDFFKGSNYIGELAIVGAITFIPMFLMNAVTSGPSAALRLSVSGTIIQSVGDIMSLLLALPVIYITIAWSMAGYLVVFYDMKAWPALEASRQVISKKWFHFFLLFIVLAILSCLGIIAFGVGVFFTVAVFPCAMYVAFRDIVGLPEDDAPKEDILAHLVD